MGAVQSVKWASNVMCWLCDHFQRYSRGSEPEYCGGECRLRPPFAYMVGVHGGAPYIWNHEWPVMEEGVSDWCGRFERSLENNLPAYPPNPENPENCVAVLVLPDAHEDFWGVPPDYLGSPWNKKILSGYVANPKDGVCCWNCDHFQPAGGELHPNAGTCHAFPPLTYQEIIMGGASGFANGQFPPIIDGVCFWCAQWEKAKRTVGAPAGGWSNPCPVRQM